MFRLARCRRALTYLGLVSQLVLTTLSAHADRPAYVIQDFHVVVLVDSKSGALQVDEYLRVRFRKPRHGIIRQLPHWLHYAEGPIYRPPRDVLVTDQRHNELPTRVIANSNITAVQIGDPKRLQRGVQRYRISYTVPRVFGTGVPRIRWNVTGYGWNAPILRTTFTFRTPSSVATDTIQLTARAGPRDADSDANTATLVGTRTKYQDGRWGLYGPYTEAKQVIYPKRLAPGEGVVAVITLPATNLAIPPMDPEMRAGDPAAAAVSVLENPRALWPRTGGFFAWANALLPVVLLISVLWARGAIAFAVLLLAARLKDQGTALGPFDALVVRDGQVTIQHVRLALADLMARGKLRYKQRTFVKTTDVSDLAHNEKLLIKHCNELLATPLTRVPQLSQAVLHNLAREGLIRRAKPAFPFLLCLLRLIVPGLMLWIWFNEWPDPSYAVFAVMAGVALVYLPLFAGKLGFFLSLPFALPIIALSLQAPVRWLALLPLAVGLLATNIMLKATQAAAVRHKGLLWATPLGLRRLAHSRKVLTSMPSAKEFLQARPRSRTYWSSTAVSPTEISSGTWWMLLHSGAPEWSSSAESSFTSPFTSGASSGGGGDSVSSGGDSGGSGGDSGGGSDSSGGGSDW